MIPSLKLQQALSNLAEVLQEERGLKMVGIRIEFEMPSKHTVMESCGHPLNMN